MLEHGPSATHLIYAIVGFAATQAAIVIGFLIKAVWGGNKAHVTDLLTELKVALKANSQVTNDNTVAVKVLTYRIETVEERLSEVKELRKDLNDLGDSVRKKSAGTS